MDIFGSYRFNAPLDRVWDLLMDPNAISSCIPGCDRFEPDGDDRYNVTLSVAMAAITGTYQGTVTLRDKTPHQSYRLEMEGHGRPGFVKGTSVIALRPTATQRRWTSAVPSTPAVRSRGSGSVSSAASRR